MLGCLFLHYQLRSIMGARKMLRSMLILLSGIGLGGCISLQTQTDDPLYAGYHRVGVPGGVTTAITDREALIPEAAPRERSLLDQSEAEVTTDYYDDTMSNWYRQYYLDESAFQFNLSYHLYGPYYFYDLRTRYLLSNRPQWYRLPRYANGWMFSDLWWDYYYWNDWWYDPWYGYYDPWYNYYDPWYYGNPYYYHGGYGFYSSSNWRYWDPWYRTYNVSSVQTTATERRPENRIDLPTGLDPGLSSDMTIRITPQTGQSQLEYVSTPSNGQASQSEETSSPTPSNRQARPAQREANYTASSSTSSSSSRSSSSTRSTASSSSRQSSSSSQQGSSSTARPADREP